MKRYLIVAMCLLTAAWCLLILFADWVWYHDHHVRTYDPYSDPLYRLLAWIEYFCRRGER